MPYYIALYFEQLRMLSKRVLKINYVKKTKLNERK